MTAPVHAPERPVVVVGAGPVGLAAALGLAQRGIPVLVLDRSSTVPEGSRAICISRHSLEILHRLGAGEAFAAQAVPWYGGRSFYRDAEVLRFQMPHTPLDVQPPMVNLSQAAATTILAQELERRCPGSVRWGTELTQLHQTQDGVTLQVRTAAGTAQLEAAYCVATDGARSTVRQLLGLQLAGTSYEGRYVIADILWRSELPAERLVWFDPPSNPGSTIIMHRQPSDIWRVDYQLHDDDDADLELDEQRIRHRVDRHLQWLGSDQPWSLRWSSLYRAHALSLDRYVHGRVLFAGDAAHLVPIFGVRGLNGGLEDADTLAWQLAAVHRGHATAALLDTYASERRDAWQQNIDAASMSTLFMTPGSHGYRTSRDAVLALAARHEPFRALINPRQSAATHARASVLTRPDTRPATDAAAVGGPAPGDPTYDQHLTELTPHGPEQTTLNRLRGTGFAVIGFDVAPDRLAHAARRLAKTLSTEQCRAIEVRSSAATADAIADGQDVTIADGQQGPGSDLDNAAADVLVVLDEQAALASAWQARPGEVVVLRPEGLVLARLDSTHLDTLDRLAARLTAAIPVVPASQHSPSHAAAVPAVTHLEMAWRTLSDALDDVPASGREGLLTRLALLLAADHVPEPALAAAVAEARQSA